MRELTAGTLTVDVAIVGAGPAGLTAGYLLAKAGKSVAIVEKDEVHVGGISRTVEHEGLRFAVGGQRFFSGNRAVVDLWNELLPGDLTERRWTSRIYHDGKLYACPPRLFEALRQLGPLCAAKCLFSYLRYKARPIRQVRSAEDWATNRFGRKLHSILFKPYVEKLWGMPCDAIAADWAARRFKRLSLLGAATGTPREAFRYAQSGPGTMWDAARDRIVEMGGAMLMGRALDQLASDGEGGWRLSAKRADGQVVIRAAHAISSAPLRELAARLYPLPDTTWNASKLKYRDFLTVALKLRAPAIFPADRIYVHDSRVRVGQVQNCGVGSPEMGPGDGAVALGLGYFCHEGDELWSMADGDLVALAAKELDMLGLVSPDAVAGGTVVRLEKAYPVYDEDYAANLTALRREIEARHPTLHLVGRGGTHRDDSMDEAMTSAMLTVETILAGEARAAPAAVLGASASVARAA